ncbi:hypothetical protein FH972_002285 [Carpinus fangiana]|uniref:OPA3-like protein n=1 Tax=Carpinus fangiana TaxID=176857 RepID=A0A5N6QED2_9ROSI|nr:hypothetical protein FH972_002285 [Carpinus fangiana]KAE7997673.1 hypothetical protein FH972_002285 [Carpinus fangiana]
MVLPLLKLGTLALKTLSKPVASRLKQQAAFHPRFRQLIIDMAQVAGVAVIFEVQRSSRSEARKEELRKQEFEAMRQRDEELAREVELLKQKLEELEQLAKGRGLGGLFNIRNANIETGKAAEPA